MAALWVERLGRFGRDLGGKINRARCLTGLVGGRQREELRKTRCFGFCNWIDDGIIHSARRLWKHMGLTEVILGFGFCLFVYRFYFIYWREKKRD